ncbi:DUF1576 domain-containing protein [uncultured Thiohalocapsa sp.]|uniref:DUF1576 domain-containing protein n=1 Tax=uncultured Thiohalocapsa sp. TaxID=768990 RepID=UPI0025DBF886|nr:DUF1576 domain-containing protein [uncultured Thiohalocapsa sp.]
MGESGARCLLAHILGDQAKSLSLPSGVPLRALIRSCAPENNAQRAPCAVGGFRAAPADTRGPTRQGAAIGKNLLNVWFIAAGVWLYARFRGEPFAQHINRAFFGVALAPIVSEILFSSALTLTVSIPLAAVTGLVIGALLSVAGFGAFGKHVLNISPIMAGVFLGTLLKPLGAADPSLQLAALFATNLAPIAGHFGWHWGVVAGFTHSSAALTVGGAHGGLNLYNNGFAAGIVASILAPVAFAIREGRQHPADTRAGSPPGLTDKHRQCGAPAAHSCAARAAFGQLVALQQ